PIVRLLFERAHFGPDATARAAFALTYLAPGLIIFSLVNILARAFFALGDTKTPMKISIFCLAVNLIVALLLVWRFRQAGLGIAKTLSATVNLCLLMFALRKKLQRLGISQLRQTFFPLLTAGIAAGLTAFLVNRSWEKWIGHDHLPQKIGAVFVPMILAASLYFALSFWLKIPSAREVFDLVRQKFNRSAGR
ncbi:MAG: lipid II flippase MurJ, partial [Limisphaerales bacterium]